MNLGTFLDESKKIVKEGWIIAASTDRYLVDTWPMTRYSETDISEDKILEIRVFNTGAENRLCRPSISSEFTNRCINDTKEDQDDCFDEVQYLDIDEEMSNNSRDGMAVTTGGGKYYLPLNKMHDAKVRIRYYLGRYEETGQVRVRDWRILEFI